MSDKGQQPSTVLLGDKKANEHEAEDGRFGVESTEERGLNEFNAAETAKPDIPQKEVVEDEDVLNTSNPTPNQDIDMEDCRMEGTTLDRDTPMVDVERQTEAEMRKILETKSVLHTPTSKRISKASRPNNSAHRAKERLKKRRRETSPDAVAERKKRRADRLRCKEEQAKAVPPTFDPTQCDLSWKEELMHPLERLTLEKRSETPNLTDPYWIFQHICNALDVAMISEESTDSSLEDGNMEGDKGDNSDHTGNEKDGELDATEESSSIWKLKKSPYDNSFYLNHETIMASGGVVQERDISSVDSYLIVPIKATVVAFDRQQMWFDNPAYQREDHHGACKRLGIVNTDIPKLKGMRPGMALLFWQPVAVDAMREFEANELLQGCILVDGVGLGKTMTTGAYLLSVSILP